MSPRRKYTNEEEQELALTTVGENDDCPPDDYESEYDDFDEASEPEYDGVEFFEDEPDFVFEDDEPDYSSDEE